MNPCIWKVAPEDRRCKFCIYNLCEKYAPPEAKDASPDADRYARILSELVGEEILTDCRKRPLVWARFFLYFQLFRDGYRHSEIAEAVGRNRSSIIHGIESVREMQRHPWSYDQELCVWDKFEKELSLRKNMNYEH